MIFISFLSIQANGDQNDILLKKIANNCELLFCLENLITDSRIKFLIERLGTDFWFDFVSEFYADEKISINLF